MIRPPKGHPQYELRHFYMGAAIYLTLEVILFVIPWMIQLFIFTFMLPNDSFGDEFRNVNFIMLFHITAPFAMQQVVQQTCNANSVSWWVFFGFFLPLAVDVHALLLLTTEYVPKTPQFYWAWVVPLVFACINLCFTLFAVWWYIAWFLINNTRGIPKPAAFLGPQRVISQNLKRKGIL